MPHFPSSDMQTFLGKSPAISEQLHYDLQCKHGNFPMMRTVLSILVTNDSIRSVEDGFASYNLGFSQGLYQDASGVHGFMLAAGSTEVEARGHEKPHGEGLCPLLPRHFSQTGVTDAKLVTLRLQSLKLLFRVSNPGIRGVFS